MRTILRCITILGLLLAASVRSDPLQSDERLTLSLESVPLAKVLKMIADQNKLNLVMSDNVQGTISVQLDSVDLRTALDAILTANGYAYFLYDNVIVVKTQESATAGEMDSRMVVLKYLDPVTAKKALESRKSPKGQIIILDKQVEEADKKGGYQANRIVITDYPTIVNSMVALVAQMDVPERIVLIEAKIVETSLDSQSKLGFVWPTAAEANLTGANDGSTITGTSTTVASNFAAGSKNLNEGRWTWGTLSVTQLQAVLDILSQDGKTKLISDPRITTVENHEAEIIIATIIPIQTINRFSEGAAIQDVVTFQDEEVGISLKVTPRINQDGKITLDVEPRVEDIIGFNGPPGNQKPIKASRSVKTRITVADGETAALGGLLKENDIKTIQRVPLLGHIPLLGKLLFTSTSNEKSTTDLMILITPHILP